MVLTNERAEVLVKYLTDKKEEGFEIFEMEASKAVEKINADGFDFTLEEIRDFAELVNEYVPDEDELDEKSLEDVAGGCGAAVIVLIIGFAYAYYVYKKNYTRRR